MIAPLVSSNFSLAIPEGYELYTRRINLATNPVINHEQSTL
jgi:hypothetical protein